MFQYVLRRLLVAIPMLLGAMSIVFFAMRILPGDPCMAMMGDQATTEALADCTKNLGLRPAAGRAVRGLPLALGAVRLRQVLPPGLPGQRVHRPHVPAHLRAGHGERHRGGPGRRPHRDRLGAQAAQSAHRLPAADLRPAGPLHARVLAGHPAPHRLLAPPRHLPAHRRRRSGRRPRHDPLRRGLLRSRRLPGRGGRRAPPPDPARLRPRASPWPPRSAGCRARPCWR